MDELGNLLWIADHVDSGKYDVIVVDAAPTGETLRLLSLPEASRWWVEKIAPIGRRMTRLGGPMIQRMIGLPVPKQEVFDAAERLLRRLDDLRRMLIDPDITSVRMVLALDKLSVAEARRTFTYFHLFGYPSDLVVANRVLPENAGGYFEELRRAQQRYLPMVEQEFGPVPVRTVPQFDHEMVGIERLRELGAALFPDGEDPANVLYRGKPYQIKRQATATRCWWSCRSRARTRSTCRARGTSWSCRWTRGGARCCCHERSLTPAPRARRWKAHTAHRLRGSGASQERRKATMSGNAGSGDGDGDLTERIRELEAAP